MAFLLRKLVRTGILLATVSASAPAWSATASELFADGNRLFRDDLYWAALLRFREAAEAGMDTPLLHYNTGIAHYKASQHVRARESLEKAAAYGPLTAISHYNLGLNAYRLGDYDEALTWFRRAANQEDRKDIARLARRAIRQLEEERATLDPVMVVQAEIVERERDFANLDFRMRTGVGMDDNVFRSPSEPYIDFSDPNTPLVTPEVQSGMYIPVSLRARYQVNSFENEGFFGSYRFGGRFYQDEQLNNADEYLQEIAFGSEFGNRTEEEETRVYSAFKIAQHEENYYDPDNGNERVIGGVDVSDRMNYLRYGPEFWGRKRKGRYTFGFRATGRLYNYDDVTQVPEYDHEYWLMGLHSQIHLSQAALLRINASYYTRRFGDRPSFELDGTQPLGNPPVRYDYMMVSVEARQRVARWFWFGMGYSRTNREDRHVGYNNYIRDEYSLRLNLRIGERFRLEATGRFLNYNYENAFAFHEPAQGRKTMERAVGSVLASFAMTEHFDLVAEFFYRETASNDTRLAYDRTQAVLGVRWVP
jgi:tetratricopeptide (TPR) repeat protein